METHENRNIVAFFLTIIDGLYTSVLNVFITFAF
jgi:hypothetical protein